MIPIKRVNLFPIIFSFKKFGLTWQKIGYCCGLTFYELKFLLMLRFAFKDTISFRCPQCGKKYKIKMNYHSHKVIDKKTMEENKLLRKW